jgi:3-phosphoshikimate 1-carboxyvinyltransferase
VRKEPDRVEIAGMDVIGRKAGGEWCLETGADASCGEAGLCLRMYSAIAALLPVPVELQAQGSLRVRPMDMVVESLKAFGVECSADGGLPPVRIHGPLRGGQGRVDGAKSSQFLTGLLIALACAEGDSVVEVTNLASKGYVDLTSGHHAAFRG